MKFKVLTFDKLEGKRNVSVVEGENADSVREDIASPSIQVISVSSLSVVQRIKEQEQNAPRRVYVATAVLRARHERRLIKAQMAKQ